MSPGAERAAPPRRHHQPVGPSRPQQQAPPCCAPEQRHHGQHLCRAAHLPCRQQHASQHWVQRQISHLRCAMCDGTCERGASKAEPLATRSGRRLGGGGGRRAEPGSQHTPCQRLPRTCVPRGRASRASPSSAPSACSVSSARTIVCVAGRGRAARASAWAAPMAPRAGGRQAGLGTLSTRQRRRRHTHLCGRRGQPLECHDVVNAQRLELQHCGCQVAALHLRHCKRRAGRAAGAGMRRARMHGRASGDARVAPAAPAAGQSARQPAHPPVASGSCWKASSVHSRKQCPGRTRPAPGGKAGSESPAQHRRSSGSPACTPARCHPSAAAAGAPARPARCAADALLMGAINRDSSPVSGL